MNKHSLARHLVRVDPIDLPCPTCEVAKGASCKSRDKLPHAARKRLAEDANAERQRLAAWERAI
jgi:hypothetical protein